jgi:hypothetical protein
MAIRVVGAGVGRTGTLSLKTALEQLVGQPCYHMLEVFSHPEHVTFWREAAEGGKVDWTGTLAEYGATSDFPACLFWQEILDANPDAVVVLSTRKDSRSWWESASQTIFSIDGAHLPPEMADWYEMWKVVATTRFTGDWSDETAARAAYDRHNSEVRSSAPADRLVDWKPGDGWEPLCKPLGLSVPAEPFPHLNMREDFPTVDENTNIDEALENFGHGE